MVELLEWIEFVDDADGLRMLVRRADIDEVFEFADGTGRVFFNTDNEYYDFRDYEAVAMQLRGTGHIVVTREPGVHITYDIAPCPEPKGT